MSGDPFNQLPTDPAWVHKAEALSKNAAAELGCMVLLVGIQQNGKTIACIEGQYEGDKVSELMKKGPEYVVAWIAQMMALQTAVKQARGTEQ